MTVKYFKPLSIESLAKRTQKAVEEASYIDLTNALENCSEAKDCSEPFLKAFKELANKPEPTKFESIFLMMVYKSLQAEIELGGE